jgi:hypothetical protein
LELSTGSRCNRREDGGGGGAPRGAARDGDGEDLAVISSMEDLIAQPYVSFSRMEIKEARHERDMMSGLSIDLGIL